MVDDFGQPVPGEVTFKLEWHLAQAWSPIIIIVNNTDRSF